MGSRFINCLDTDKNGWIGLSEEGRAILAGLQ